MYTGISVCLLVDVMSKYEFYHSRLILLTFKLNSPLLTVYFCGLNMEDEVEALRRSPLNKSIRDLQDNDSSVVSNTNKDKAMREISHRPASMATHGLHVNIMSAKG